MNLSNIRTLFHKTKRLRHVLIAAVVVVVIVLMTATLIANTSYVKDKVISMATEALSKELHTDVEIDDIGLNLLGQRASIRGIRLKDQQQRDLLQVKELGGSLRLLPLLGGRVVLKELKAEGVEALIIAPKDSVANYQFLIDATKKNPKDKHREDKPKKNSTFKVDLSYALMKDVHVKYNDQEFRLERAIYDLWRGKHTLTVHHLETGATSRSKRGPVYWNFDTGMVTATLTDEGEKHVDIKGLTVKSDCDIPRRNEGKPKHGAFDDRHMDVTADMGIDILHIGKDSVTVRISQGWARDTTAGINLTDLRANLVYSNKSMKLTDVIIQQTDTRIDIPKADILLPDKQKGTSLRYSADSVRARVFLKDISQPFAPVLKQFSLPLNVRVAVNGTSEGMVFRGIHVENDDRLLEINATGILRHLRRARDLTLHFDVHDMVAKPGVKDKILKQFTVKKYMMNQFFALGIIKYHGDFDIVWKKETFRGLLNTEKGNLDFVLELNDSTKYLTGRVNTDSLHLGQLFMMKELTDIDCTADFCIDYSKKRTAELRKEKGGKLPIGHVEADIRKVGLNPMYMEDIQANITSDGALAKGEIFMKKSRSGLVLDFTFTNTTEVHKVKVKPRLKNLIKPGKREKNEKTE